MTREMLFPIEREEGSTLQTQICDALSRAISSKLSRSDIGFANTFERVSIVTMDQRPTMH